MIAWNGDGITCDYSGAGLPDEVYQKANVTSAEQALQAAAAIGYPVMVKASEGASWLLCCCECVDACRGRWLVACVAGFGGVLCDNGERVTDDSSHRLTNHNP